MNVGLKRAIAVVIIIAIGVVSATVLAEHFSSPQTYAKTIETLDEKRNSVLAMTASAAAISTGLTIIPGDVATPLADKLADLSSTFMIVLCAIFLEKYMLAFAGIAAFRVLIPLACLLIAVFCIRRASGCLRIARKSDRFRAVHSNSGSCKHMGNRIYRGNIFGINRGEYTGNRQNGRDFKQQCGQG